MLKIKCIHVHDADVDLVADGHRLRQPLPQVRLQVRDFVHHDILAKIAIKFISEIYICLKYIR